MKIFSKRTTFFLLVSSLAIAPITASAETLLDIYEQALTNDAQLKADRAAFEAGQEYRALGRADLLPQVIGSASYSKSDFDVRERTGNTGTRSNDSTRKGWTVSLDQPLFNMASWYSYQQGIKLSEQAEAQFGADQQSLIVRVANAYFNVLRSIDTLEATIAEENALEHQLEQTQQRFEVGLTAITEVHEAQAAYDSATAATFEARGALGIAYEALEVLTGRTHDQVAPLAANFPVVAPVPADRHQWVEFSLNNNYRLKAARLSADAAGETAKGARSGHLPTVSASLSYSDNRDDGQQFDTRTDGSTIGLNLRVPLYSGGATSSRTRQAYALFTQSQEIFNNTQRNVIQSARALHLSVETGVSQVYARKQAIVSSQSALEATRSGYEVGTRNLVEVLQSQRQLYQARRNYATALYDYIINTIQLREVAGMLTPADVQEIDRWLEAQAPVNRSQYVQ